MSPRLPSSFVLLCLLAAACVTPPSLDSKSAVVPDGVNLSGQWRITDESADTNRRIVEDRRRAAGRGTFSDPRRSTAKKGSLVYLFLETGAQLKITQTDSGLFVSFDRSIVEEYRFGENRAINVGPVAAIRASGWEDGGYIVETLGEKGHRLVERYLLEDGGRLLLRQISIFRKDELLLSVVQRFEKA